MRNPSMRDTDYHRRTVLRWMKAAFWFLPLAAACATSETPPGPAPAPPAPPQEAVVVSLDVPRRWEVADLLPYAYVTAADGEADPSCPLFSDFIIQLSTLDGRTLIDELGKEAAGRADWIASLETLFDHRHTLTAALEDLGGLTDTHFRIWVNLPYPSRRQEAWGPLDGRLLDFRRLADRKQALTDILERALSRWTGLARKHVTLAGFVWGPVAMWETTGARHWEDRPDERGDFNTDENLVAWVRDEMAARGLQFLWLPDHNDYVFDRAGPHRHLAPWRTRQADGTPLFDQVYLAPPNSAHLEYFAESLVLHRVGLAATEDSDLEERQRLDELPAVFRLSPGDRPRYERVVSWVQRRRATGP